MHIEQTSDRIDIYHEEVLLACLIYRPDVPRNQSPRPYLHPVKTLKGITVTDFQPDDHLWHHGLSMTCAYLSGWQFWGGRTYMRDQGYVWLDNFGRQQHIDWTHIHADENAVRLVERLHWLDPDDRRIIAETRDYRFRVDTDHWSLETRFTLTNLSGQTLEFGSPTTQGREEAGYGGWFWRGASEMLGGSVQIEGGSGEEVRGQRSPWLEYRANGVCLRFEDYEDNPRYPTQWFVRSSGYPGVSFAFMFDQVYALPPGETLALTYRLTLRDEV